MSASSNYLVVYGTLRPDFKNEHAQYLRQHSQYMGECAFSGFLYDLGHYPGAIHRQDSKSYVKGSLYDISLNRQIILNHLDEYEGIDDDTNQPAEYYRTIIPVLFNNQITNCWAYLYNRAITDQPLVTSGDYWQYLSSGKTDPDRLE